MYTFAQTVFQVLLLARLSSVHCSSRSRLLQGTRTSPVRARMVIDVTSSSAARKANKEKIKMSSIRSSNLLSTEIILLASCQELTGALRFSR